MKVRIYEESKPEERKVFLQLQQLNSKTMLTVVDKNGERCLQGNLLVVQENGRICLQNHVNTNFGFDLDDEGHINIDKF